LCPYVKSRVQFAEWQALMPSLSHVCISSDALWCLSLPNLISLAASGHPPSVSTILASNVHSWTVPLLQYLSFNEVYVDVEAISVLATECPLLKQLRMSVRCGTDQNVHFAHFPQLQILSLNKTTYRSQGRMVNVYVWNMPQLVEFEVWHVDIDVLNFSANVSNLQRICSVYSQYSVRKLIFQDDVPLLNHIDLGASKNIAQLDPFGKVDWKRVNKFQFGYNTCCDTACAQLRNIQHLWVTNTQSCANPCVPWQHLHELENLALLGMTSEMFHAFSIHATFHSRPTSLWLNWEMDDSLIVDFAVIAKFVNLVSVILEGKKHIHFESLLTLKSLPKYFFCNITLTHAEQTVLNRWRNK